MGLASALGKGTALASLGLCLAAIAVPKFTLQTDRDHRFRRIERELELIRAAKQEWSRRNRLPGDSITQPDRIFDQLGGPPSLRRDYDWGARLADAPTWKGHSVEWWRDRCIGARDRCPL
jgi:hypothetical protein